MEEEFRFGLKQRIFNWNMRVTRQKLGLSQKALGELVGKSSCFISQFETLRAFPIPAIQEKIAEVLGVPVESIFPQWLKEFKLGAIPAAIEERSISLKEAISQRLISPEVLMIEGPEEEVEQKLLQDQVQRLLKDLTSCQKRVLNLRFGLEDGTERTLEETGQALGVSREKIRQIEGRALRRLRHPTRSRLLKEFL